MFRVFTVAAAFALLLGSGFLYGIWTDRWGFPPDVQDAVAKLEGLPTQLGDWQGESIEMDPKHVRRAQLAGFKACRYLNQKTGDAVTVYLVCGRPQYVAVHTPDVCFQGNGFEKTAPPTKFRVPSELKVPPTTFWTATF